MDNWNNRIFNFFAGINYARLVTLAGVWIIFGVLMIAVSMAAGCEAKKPFDLSSVPGPPIQVHSTDHVIRPIGF
jgi:hypothetical protein